MAHDERGKKSRTSKSKAASPRVHDVFAGSDVSADENVAVPSEQRATSAKASIAFGVVTPILRMFDIAKAREFYIGWLGFESVFEHRFEEGFPLYWGIRRGDLHMHLSEHHGDASPGSHVRVLVSGIEALHEELIAKKYGYGRPGLESTPWQSREITVHDPFGNRITFSEPISVE